MRAALDAPSFPAAAGALLELAARWSPIAFGTLLGDALEAAAYAGRDAVFDDGLDLADFAEGEGFNVASQPFREQIEFFRQKRVKPTKAFTDAMRAVHDRAFVIAGATDTAMMSDFQTALADAMENGGTLEEFRKDFDRIVKKYGWSYNGERGWRTRVIFEANIRTAYMAGRLKQMRDPDVVRLRPWWEYRHGETRIPLYPRRLHLSWHGTILRYDNEWWKTHFAPNGYLCSCGIRTLSDADLRKRGKSGPDPTPPTLMEPFVDPVSGQLVEKVQGIDYGWDYMPGDAWERGLTPSTLIEEGAELLGNPRQPVAIDVPEPLTDLLTRARPLSAKPLPDALADEDYVRGFLQPLGADIGRAVLFEDRAGAKLPISDQLFVDGKGGWRLGTAEHAAMLPLFAEALIDPDEIWIGLARRNDADAQDLVVDRRYVRATDTGLVIVVQIGDRWWEAITGHYGVPGELRAVEWRRSGKLVYRRRAK